MRTYSAQNYKISFQSKQDSNVQLFQKPKLLQKSNSTKRIIKTSQNDLQKSSSCNSLGQNFNKSLISRIRCVSRNSQKDAQIKKIVGMLPNTNSKLQKSKQNFNAFKDKFYGKGQTGLVEQIKQQKCNVNEIKINSMDMEKLVKSLEQKNKVLQKQLQNFECQLFICKQKIQQLSSDIEERDEIIKEMQNQLRYAQINIDFNHKFCEISQKYQQLLIKYQRKEQIKEEQQSQKDNQFIQISKVINQKIEGYTSSEKLTLFKANSQIAFLKKQICNIEKNHQKLYCQLKNRKDIQIQEMRKRFAKNLNHYKDIIIKCTTKGGTKLKKQELHETTITQNSSDQE